MKSKGALNLLTAGPENAGFILINGQAANSESSREIDWSGYASAPGTLIVLTTAGQIPAIIDGLIGHGRHPQTPAVLMPWPATGPTGPLATLERIRATGISAEADAPFTLVVGDHVNLLNQSEWLKQRPLHNQRIVVTRARDQAAQLAGPLRAKGAQVLEIPVIKIAPPSEREPILEALAGLNAYDWVIFTSANGVAAFFRMFFQGFQDLRDLGGVRIAAVGPATAARLQELHLQVDLTPDEFVAAKIAQALSDFQSIENLRILLLRAEVANPELPRQLEDLGAIVDDVACYQTVAETEDHSGAAAQLTATGADWITFTSGSTVEHFHARFNLPELVQRFPKMRLASIGPETSKALAALGLHPSVEAKPHTMEGLIKALEKNRKTASAGGVAAS
jgi:uroporphyrinogen III methyltransferase / synthase